MGMDLELLAAFWTTGDGGGISCVDEVKVKFIQEQTTKAQKRSRGITLLFL